jgi:hypothetical protein
MPQFGITFSLDELVAAGHLTQQEADALTKKLLLGLPTRTPPVPGGHILDLVLLDPVSGSPLSSPILDPDVADGTTLATISATGTSGSVTFSIQTNNKFSIVGTALKRNVAGGAIVEGTPEAVQIYAEDARGPSGSYAEQFTFDVWDQPSAVKLSGGTTGTIVDSDPAGTVVGTLSSVGGKPPKSYAVTGGGSEFTVAVLSGVPTLVRSGSGTLTAPGTKSPQVTVTDALGATANATFTITLTSTPSTAAGFTEDIVVPFTPVVYLDYIGAGDIGTPNAVTDGGATPIWQSSSTDIPAAGPNKWNAPGNTFTSLSAVYQRACVVGQNVRIIIRTPGVTKAYLKTGFFNTTPPAGFAPVSVSFEHNLGYTSRGTLTSGVDLRPEPNFYLKGPTVGTGDQLLFDDGGPCTAEYFFTGFSLTPFPADVGAVTLNGATVPLFTTHAYTIFRGARFKGINFKNCVLAGSRWNGAMQSNAYHWYTSDAGAYVRMMDCEYYHCAPSGSLYHGIYSHFSNAFLRRTAGHTCGGHIFKAALCVRFGLVDSYLGGHVKPAWDCATFTGSITGSVLTVTAMAAGSNNIKTNTFISGAGIPAGVKITSQLSGTTGKAGTYQLNTSAPVGSETIQAVWLNTQTVGFNPLLNFDGTNTDFYLLRSKWAPKHDSNSKQCINMQARFSEFDDFNPKQPRLVPKNYTSPGQVLWANSGTENATHFYGVFGVRDLTDTIPTLGGLRTLTLPHPWAYMASLSYGTMTSPDGVIMTRVSATATPGLNQWNFDDTVSPAVVKANTIAGNITFRHGSGPGAGDTVLYLEAAQLAHSAGTYSWPASMTVDFEAIRDDGTKFGPVTATITPASSARSVNVTLSTPWTGVGATPLNTVCRFKLTTQSWDRPVIDSTMSRMFNEADPDYYWAPNGGQLTGGKLDFAKQSAIGKPDGIPVGYIEHCLSVPTSATGNAVLFHQNPQCYRGAFASDINCSPPMGPMPSYPGSDWATPANSGFWDGDIHGPSSPPGGRNASARGGLNGSGWVRPNMTVISGFLGYDKHLATKYRSSGNGIWTDGSPGTTPVPDGLEVSTGTNVKWNAPSGATYDALLGFDGLVQISERFKGTPSNYPTGTDFEVTVGASPGDDTIRVADGTAFTVGTSGIWVEADTFAGPGRGVHYAEVTAKTVIGAGPACDITFDPPLPDSSSYEGEKGIAAFQDLTLTAGISSGAYQMQFANVTELAARIALLGPIPFTFLTYPTATFFITAANAGTGVVTFDPPAPGSVSAGARIHVEGGRGVVAPKPRALPAGAVTPAQMFAGIGT